METDLHLINKVKEEGDSFSVKELIDRHSGIYVEMVNKYLPDDMDGIMKNDVLEDKNFCIYDAAIKFDESKNTKFPQCSVDQTFESNVSCDSATNKIQTKEDIERIFLAIDLIKDNRAKKIFKMRYKNTKKLTPWKNIAKKLDLSIQGCINIHNKHLTEIKKYV